MFRKKLKWLDAVPPAVRQPAGPPPRQDVPLAMPPVTPEQAWPRQVLFFSQQEGLVDAWQEDLDRMPGRGGYVIRRVTQLAALERAIQVQRWSACLVDLALAEPCGLGVEQVEWLSSFAPCLAYCAQPALAEEEEAALVDLGYVGWLGEGSSGEQLDGVLEQLLAAPEAAAVPALRPPPPVPVAPGRPPARPGARQRSAQSGLQDEHAVVAAPQATRSLAGVPGTTGSCVVPGTPATSLDLTLACWSPFDTLELDVAALNLGVAFCRQGLRTLVGECRRPAGALVTLLGMDATSQERSLLRAARASQTDPLYREHYGAFLETHLLLGQAVPASVEPLHLFISSPPDNGVALLEEADLNPERSRFVPALLEKARRFWHVSLFVVGSNVADPLHLEVLRAARRLLVLLPVETDALARAEQLLPALLAVTEHPAASVDVVLAGIDRGLPGPDWGELSRLLARPEADGRKVAQAVARWQHTQAERRQEELARRRQEVAALLKRLGLPSKPIGELPDSLRWMRLLRQKSRKELAPLLCHPELATCPYAQATLALAATWTQAAQAASQ